jgi:glycosyltransferase involved in cell wall biosynthesis
MQKMLEVIVYSAFTATTILLCVIAHQLKRALKTFNPPKYHSPLGAEVDLPSVTVCIPARNEQHALAYCLEKVIASKYDKLEIIVLDDVSGDDTSALIKSFASEGVRFVKGQSLPDGWLGKNHALQGLLNEASGSYVLFMDVDTRLSEMAIENMVRYAIAHRLSMLSVLPRREDGWRMSVLLSPLRYFWELVFNRRLSPPSASNAWLIKRTVLESQFQGFTSLKSVIQPEAAIADALSTQKAYAFLMSTQSFGVSYEKKWRSQLITSVRLLFPLFGGMLSTALIFALVILLLTTPFIVLLSLFVASFSFMHGIALVLALFSIALYAIYTHRVWSHGWVIGMLLWPLILLQEVILIIASVFQYKRKTVKWKGRFIRPATRS